MSVERIADADHVRAIAAALAGEEAWLVGGTVRDALLGRPLGELDVAVRGDPGRAARAVGEQLGGPVFPLSEAFGAWRALDPGRSFWVDVAPLQGQTIEEDLRKRDFTVNAMAVPVGAIGLIDPLGGERDLRAGQLRLASEHAYADDPLRPLRLARFAAQLGLRPDAHTERATAQAAPRVTEASPERVFAELRALMLAPGAIEGLMLADRTALLRAVLPEVTGLHDIEQSRYHHLDVYGHTLEVLERQIELEGRLPEIFGDLAAPLAEVLAEPLADEMTRGEALRFGALFHDIGKPATRAELPGGRVSFVGHDSVGEELIRTLCRRLRTSTRLADYLGALTRHHLVLGFLVHSRPLSRRDVYGYLKTVSPVEVEVTLLTCADRLATRGRKAEPAIAAHLELARELMAEALEWRAAGPPRPPLRGDELAEELDVAPGPELGRLLAELEEAAFAGEARTRAEAVELARRLRQNPER